MHDRGAGERGGNARVVEAAPRPRGEADAFGGNGRGGVCGLFDGIQAILMKFIRKKSLGTLPAVFSFKEDGLKHVKIILTFRKPFPNNSKPRSYDRHNH